MSEGVWPKQNQGKNRCKIRIFDNVECSSIKHFWVPPKFHHIQDKSVAKQTDDLQVTLNQGCQTSPERVNKRGLVWNSHFSIFFALFSSNNRCLTCNWNIRLAIEHNRFFFRNYKSLRSKHWPNIMLVLQQMQSINMLENTPPTTPTIMYFLIYSWSMPRTSPYELDKQFKWMQVITVRENYTIIILLITNMVRWHS